MQILLVLSRQAETLLADDQLVSRRAVEPLFGNRQQRLERSVVFFIHGTR